MCVRLVCILITMRRRGAITIQLPVIITKFQSIYWMMNFKYHPCVTKVRLITISPLKSHKDTNTFTFQRLPYAAIRKRTKRKKRIRHKTNYYQSNAYRQNVGNFPNGFTVNFDCAAFFEWFPFCI